MPRKPRASKPKPLEIVSNEFGFHLANGTLCPEVLEGLDYLPALHEQDLWEGVSSVLINAMEFGPDFEVLNAEAAKRRAAQWLRQRVDPTYIADPPFPENAGSANDRSTPKAPSGVG